MIQTIQWIFQSQENKKGHNNANKFRILTLLNLKAKIQISKQTERKAIVPFHKQMQISLVAIAVV